MKERYREEPEAAVVTLSTTGQLGEGVSCSVQTGLRAEGEGEQLDTLPRLTERYCVVLQTIAGSPQLSTTFETA